MSRTRSSEAVPTADEVETALSDLRWALEEDDRVEKHYHVRSAMQRLELILQRAERR